MSAPVVLSVIGQIDDSRIATMVKQVSPHRRVIVDLSQATGSSSMHIAACVQIALTTGVAVRVRGCDHRLAVAVRQMHLGHLVHIEQDREAMKA